MLVPAKLERIISALPRYRETLMELREIVLANTVMFGEITAPTFAEEGRIRFLQDRFTECALQNICTDEAGNGMAVVQGKTSERNILVVAHVDTVFPATVDHTVTVGKDSLTGPGIADNSLGLAVVASLPKILEKLGLHFNSNLVLLGTNRSLGHGNLAGLRFFLDNVRIPLHAAVCVEGIHLGRLSYSCLGLFRGEIVCRAPENTDREPSGSGTAINSLNKILAEILDIPIPSETRTSIVPGTLLAGAGFNTPPHKALLRLEVRSEKEGMVGKIKRRIVEIIDEIDAEDGIRAELKVIARRRPGSLASDHPIVESTRKIMEALGLEPVIAPSVGELAALIAKKIPSITLGITKGKNRNELDETIMIEPIFGGLAQLVAVLQAIDGGYHDEN